MIFTASIEILFRIAEFSFIGEPTAAMEVTVEYTTQDGTWSTWCGTFIVSYSIWGSIGWGFWEGELYASALPEPDTPWEFGSCGPLLTQRLHDL